MKEAFAQGKRELIDTLAQLLSPLSNIQGLNTNGGNGRPDLMQREITMGLRLMGRTFLRQKGATTELR
jgi:hypothetical protein